MNVMAIKLSSWYTLSEKCHNDVVIIDRLINADPCLRILDSYENSKNQHPLDILACTVLRTDLCTVGKKLLLDFEKMVFKLNYRLECPEGADFCCFCIRTSKYP